MVYGANPVSPCNMPGFMRMERSCTAVLNLVHAGTIRESSKLTTVLRIRIASYL
eukprot:SAG31_NODE_46482_length_254_cov_0.670968_1_plen_53_part_10